MFAGQSNGSVTRQAEFRFSSTTRSEPSLRLTFAGVAGNSRAWFAAMGWWLYVAFHSRPKAIRLATSKMTVVREIRMSP